MKFYSKVLINHPKFLLTLSIMYIMVDYPLILKNVIIFTHIPRILATIPLELNFLRVNILLTSIIPNKNNRILDKDKNKLFNTLHFYHVNNCQLKQNSLLSPN